MIDKNIVSAIVQEQVEKLGCYLVDVVVSADNRIVVEIDSDDNVDIDTCVQLSRYVESKLDRDVEDYELEVGSCGLTAPFKVKRQYDKNIGNEIEVLAEGKKWTGVLESVNETGFDLRFEQKNKDTRKKEEVVKHFDFDEIKYAKYNLKFN
ncbi:MAG: ribosome assembly cofactor RimP [Paludibacteraceae bacterium]|nr:ribosome assembly cofactor RimP [Paludibacteraceae bacterium]